VSEELADLWTNIFAILFYEEPVTLLMLNVLCLSFLAGIHAWQANL